jgi:hypothetical protein
MNLSYEDSFDDFQLGVPSAPLGGEDSVLDMKRSELGLDVICLNSI